MYITQANIHSWYENIQIGIVDGEMMQGVIAYTTKVA